MNKKQIFLFSLILTLLANSIFAFEVKENKINEKNTVVEEASAKSKTGKEGVEVEKKLTLEEKFFQKIKNAKNEEERVLIYSQFKKDLKNNKTEVFAEKSKRIFEKFDNILNKLEVVKGAIEKNVELLKIKKIDLSLVDKKTEELDLHLDKARGEKASAWIKMQDIDFNGEEKEEILKKLIEVKKHLLVSKDEIRKASLNSKELIFFIRGALANLK